MQRKYGLKMCDALLAECHLVEILAVSRKDMRRQVAKVEQASGARCRGIVLKVEKHTVRMDMGRTWGKVLQLRGGKCTAGLRSDEEYDFDASGEAG